MLRVHAGAYVKNGSTVTYLVRDEVQLGEMRLDSSIQTSFLKIRIFTPKLVS